MRQALAFAGDKREFAKVCVKRSRIKRGKGKDGGRAARRDDAGGDEEEEGEEEEEVNLYDEGLLKGCDEEGWREYRRYCESRADPHLWWFYDPDWWRESCEIWGVMDKARFDSGGLGGM